MTLAKVCPTNHIKESLISKSVLSQIWRLSSSWCTTKWTKLQFYTAMRFTLTLSLREKILSMCCTQAPSIQPLTGIKQGYCFQSHSEWIGTKGSCATWICTRIMSKLMTQKYACKFHNLRLKVSSRTTWRMRSTEAVIKAMLTTITQDINSHQNELII